MQNVGYVVLTPPLDRTAIVSSPQRMQKNKECKMLARLCWPLHKTIENAKKKQRMQDFPIAFLFSLHAMYMAYRPCLKIPKEWKNEEEKNRTFILTTTKKECLM